jgi:2'-5' RNA ligase
MPGASWPAWGGHITLVPNFVPKGTVEEVRSILWSVCVEEEPFLVRLHDPVALQDMTRPDYFAVFLRADDREGDEQRLHALREALLGALEAMREDVRPDLIEQPFLPHVTLALGVGESEAERLVRSMRAEPLAAEFMVEVVWLVTQSVGEETHFDRYPIQLGRVAPVELLRD